MAIAIVQFVEVFGVVEREIGMIGLVDEQCVGFVLVDFKVRDFEAMRLGEDNCEGENEANNAGDDFTFASA